MAIVNGQGTTFNLPNFVGELFAITPTETPFLSAIGGLTGGLRTNTKEFAFQNYELPAAKQPIDNLEGQDAPAPTEIDRDQVTNVVQIFHETLEISYTKQAATGNISGLSILGNQPVMDEVDWQTQRKLEVIARDIEYTFLNGTYSNPATNTSPGRQTRGMLEAISTNVVDGSASSDFKAALNELLLTMYNNGAPFGSNTVIIVNGYQKQQISAAYGYAPEDRNIGGVNINQIETDFGRFGVMLNRYMPADTVLVADLSVCAPVFLEIPGKGFLFREELARTGAAFKYQIYGEIGLEHGPETFHGKIENLPTS